MSPQSNFLQPKRDCLEMLRNGVVFIKGNPEQGRVKVSHITVLFVLQIYNVKKYFVLFIDYMGNTVRFCNKATRIVVQLQQLLGGAGSRLCRAAWVRFAQTGPAAACMQGVFRAP